MFYILKNSYVIVSYKYCCDIFIYVQKLLLIIKIKCVSNRGEILRLWHAVVIIRLFVYITNTNPTFLILHFSSVQRECHLANLIASPIEIERVGDAVKQCEYNATAADDGFDRACSSAPFIPFK